MEMLKGAKFVRLMSEKTDKYVSANAFNDHISLSCLDPDNNDLCWCVELVDQNSPDVVAFKSYQTGKYLAATKGGRIVQSDDLFEWMPVNEGSHIKLKTRTAGSYLRVDIDFYQSDILTLCSDVIARDIDDECSFMWMVDVLDAEMSSRFSSVYLPDSLGGSSLRSELVEEGTSSVPIQTLTSGRRLNCNRWNVLALILKATIRLKLLLTETYKIQERMKLHCGLFPSDYEFERDTLVQLWMAAGYLKDERMEEYGGRYFDILSNKQLIVFSRIDNSSGERMYLTNVPDETLQSKDSDLCTILKDEHMIDEGAKSWHVSLVSNDIDQDIFTTLKRFKELKTLLFVRNYGPSLERVPSDIFLALPSMEALDLSGSHITELPSSIGNLRQLRYLNLSFTLIESLPETIGRLKELQTLNLVGCKQLYALPKAFKKLVNLRHLCFDVLGQLSFMPKGIGCLTQLRTLTAFIVDDCNIRELGYMNNLTGSCCISGLQNVASHEPKESVLHNKVHLTKLQLRWNEYDGCYQNFDFDASYLEPHSCLEELQMLYYPNSKLPGWIREEKYKRLNNVTLRKCNIHELDACLGRLPNLKRLAIIQLDRVETINHSTRAYFREVSFPRLEKLIIDGMYNLTSWIGVDLWDFPLLSELSIKDCPIIRILPFLPFLCSLKVLEIVDCSELESLSDRKLKLPEKLETLTVDDCPLLNENYFYGEDAQWDKIKHVRHIWFDLEDLHSLSTAPGTSLNFCEHF
ncbi:hypothetical protein vseg_014308 [Gypsophila vaccaria]